mmetsp:Transcript_18535/g.37317  ORF Transcript_18535/g.37317 Transcript_18535/m.37317 type:complete len:206 (+) Transcript_18535:552-1169(+)
MPCWHWWHCWQHGQTVPDPRALCRATPGKCTLPRAEFSARRPTASPTEGTFDRSIGAPRSSSSSCLRSSRLHPRDRHPRHRDGRNPPIPSTCPSYRTARKSSPWDTFFPTSSCSNREGRLSSRRVPPFPPPPRRRRRRRHRDRKGTSTCGLLLRGGRSRRFPRGSPCHDGHSDSGSGSGSCRWSCRRGRCRFLFLFLRPCRWVRL